MKWTRPTWRGMTPRRIAFHILLFIVVLVLLSLPIWLGIGPVVHSRQI
jgi:hypothetical protein